MPNVYLKKKQWLFWLKEAAMNNVIWFFNILLGMSVIYDAFNKNDRTRCTQKSQCTTPPLKIDDTNLNININSIINNITKMLLLIYIYL